jgi:hypothetical protein
MLTSFCCGSFELFDDDDMSEAILQTFGIRVEKCIGKYILIWRGVELPPRYQQYSLCSSKEELLRIITDFFSLDLPYIHMEHLQATCSEVLECMPRVRNLRYLAIESHEFGTNVKNLISLVTITKEAPKLEVLCLQYKPDDEKPIPLQSLDQTICELVSSNFVSSMHLFAAYSCFSEPDVDMERGYFSISCSSLKLFIDALSETTADHRQVLRLEGTAILCNNHQELRELLDVSEKAPVIVEMYKCKFCIDNITL